MKRRKKEGTKEGTNESESERCKPEEAPTKDALQNIVTFVAKDWNQSFQNEKRFVQRLNQAYFEDGYLLIVRMKQIIVLLMVIMQYGLLYMLLVTWMLLIVMDQLLELHFVKIKDVVNPECNIGI